MNDSEDTRVCLLILKSQTDLIAHVSGKSAGRYGLPNYISVLILYMLNSCYFKIYTCILSVIRLLFTVPLLLNVKIGLHSHNLKLALRGKHIVIVNVIVQGEYMYINVYSHTLVLLFSFVRTRM